MKLESPIAAAAADLSLSEWWMPFTANRAFKAAPRLLSRAEGMYYYTPEGRQLIDGTAGLWCVNAGHCRAPIVEAVQRQDTQTFVFVRESATRFRRADVKLGRQAEGRVEILQGLKEGQEVVVAGGFILKSELFKEQLAGD